MQMIFAALLSLTMAAYAAPDGGVAGASAVAPDGGVADDAAAPHPEARPFDARADADAAVDAAMARAAENGKNVIIVMGGNWCHDSRALAGWFADARFAAMLVPRYELVYVDAGVPQRRGGARNQRVVKRFKGMKQKNTPYLMVISPDGKLRNRRDARSWRNAASRSEAEIFDYFAQEKWRGKQNVK